VRPIRLPNDLCARSVEYVSRELDGDLAEFEVALLRAHLGSCPSCAELRERMHAQTGALRMTPLEPMPTPVALPLRRRSSMGGAVAAVAAIAAAAVAFVTVGGIDHGDRSAAAKSPAPNGAIEGHAAIPKTARLAAMQLHWLSQQTTRILNRGYSPY
jgi:predicted anti-sigma-YlaC factor YlaD